MDKIEACQKIELLREKIRLVRIGELGIDTVTTVAGLQTELKELGIELFGISHKDVQVISTKIPVFSTETQVATVQTPERSTTLDISFAPKLRRLLSEMDEHLIVFKMELGLLEDKG